LCYYFFYACLFLHLNFCVFVNSVQWPRSHLGFFSVNSIVQLVRSLLKVINLRGFLGSGVIKVIHLRLHFVGPPPYDLISVMTKYVLRSKTKLGFLLVLISPVLMFRHDHMPGRRQTIYANLSYIARLRNWWQRGLGLVNHTATQRLFSSFLRVNIPPSFVRVL